MAGSIILLIFLIFLNAIFACAEIAVISLNDAKLRKMKQDGNKSASLLLKLTEQPSRFLATIQVAITLAGFLSSAFAADYFAGPFVNVLRSIGVPIPLSVLQTVSVILITIVLSYFSLVFGELVPKRIAMKKSEWIALKLARLLYAVSKIFSPLVSLLTVSTNGMLRLLGIPAEETDEQVTEEEIQLMLAEGNEQGNIDSMNTEFIKNVFEFDDIPAEKVCTHRIDVVALDAEDDVSEWDRIIFETGHTYYPVYEELADNIIGILNIKDYFKLHTHSKKEILKNAVDEPWFEMEKIKANSLLQKMKTRRNYFTVLVDEYGGMTGIITLHNLVEALVGDLYDTEEETTEFDIKKLDGKTWKIGGMVDLDDLSEKLDIHFLSDNFDTFNGLICDTIGRVPKNGEQFFCDVTTAHHRLHIQVLNVVNHHVESAVITKIEETVPEEETQDA